MTIRKARSSCCGPSGLSVATPGARCAPQIDLRRAALVARSPLGVCPLCGCHLRRCLDPRRGDAPADAGRWGDARTRDGVP
ncbi:hypothetical protein DB32_008560 [Sandaracinus amylolyticus]|uniref:Uncharacterized protein n=1 Tax=Sandaracinus amylolyticus TaxID=927083 RepID=A0A0F6WAA0_9BACT|nr:hypothetical protein DB32_008560 [Sandaracinus amylolyticus]